MRDPVFGFTGAPFASAPDPHCWAPVAVQRQALEAIVHCLETGRGIGILTGPAGIGKSVLCLRVAEHLQQSFRVACLPAGRFDDVTALLQAVLFELDWPYQGLGTQELRLQLTAALRELRWDCQGTVVVLDEAHTCSEDVLEELRSATNHCTEGRPLLRVLLSGQYSLEEMLTAPALDALNQRIGCHVSLEALTRAESAEFIEYRLRRAGAEPQQVVTPEALQTICYAAAGNPRCLNRLCDRSFELAAAAGSTPLDDATVRLALEELKRLPLHWNDPPPASSHTTSAPVTANDEVQERKPVVTATPLLQKKFGDDPAGETAVIEFGAGDDDSPSGNGAVEAPATQNHQPATASVSRPAPRAVSEIEIAAPAKKQTRTAETPATARAAAMPIAEPPAEKPTANDRDDDGWTSVETMSPAHRESFVEAPNVRVSEQPGRMSVRIQPAVPGRQTPPGKGAVPMQEEIVSDHYAALIAAQRRQPARATSPAAAVRPAAQPEEPPDTSPEAAIDSLLAVVSEAVGESAAVTSDGPGANPPREPAGSQPVRFHSIEDYLQSARQDAVRMARDDAESTPPVRNASSEQGPAGSRDADLYTRLRRLQER